MAGTTIEFAPSLPWIAVIALGVAAALLAGIGLYVRANGALWRTLAFAVLILNFAAPFIDQYTQPVTYGHRPQREDDE